MREILNALFFKEFGTFTTDSKLKDKLVFHKPVLDAIYFSSASHETNKWDNHHAKKIYFKKEHEFNDPKYLLISANICYVGSDGCI